MRPRTKEMIPRIEIQNQFDGTEKEVAAYKKAISDPNFVNAQTFRTQAGILCSYLRTDEILVSFNRIGKIFNEPGHCLMDQFYKFNRGYRPDGRPPTLSEEQIEMISNFIKNQHTQNNYQIFHTYYDVYIYVLQKFKIYIIREKLGHLFKSVVGKAMEQKRLDISLENIKKISKSKNEN